MPFQFIIFILVLALMIAGAHFLVYLALVYFWGFSGTSFLPQLKIIFYILSPSFVILSVLTSLFYNKILGVLYAVSAFFLGVIYWLFLASVLAFVFLGIFHLFNLNNAGLMTGKVFLVLGLLIGIYGLIHSYNTQVVNYEVALPNLPPQWENKKIVFVADTHFGNVRNVGFAKKIAALIAAQKPEMVLIPGDFVDGPPTNAKEVVEAFTNMEIPQGIYFANGNHETYHEQAELYAALIKAGVHVVNDELIEVNGLQIIGADYPTTTTEKNQSEVLKNLNIDPDKPSILIKHIPNTLNSAYEAGIDLQVSGHSHRGQIWPGPWLTAKVYGLYAYGQQKFKDMTVITTSGAGTWGPPQRVGTNGEIVVITLKKG